MKLGIFGSERDTQCQAVARAMRVRGAAVTFVDGASLHAGVSVSFDGKSFCYRGEPLDEVRGWYVRRLLSPLPPSFTLADRHYLWADWFSDYMQRRERYGYLLSWMLALVSREVPLVNGPEQGVGVQMKLLQLELARQVGLEIPATLITNDRDQVLAFASGREVVYKPSQGGGLCRPFDARARGRLAQLSGHPVCFQERIQGDCLRATFVASELVACVRIPTASLDYRDDRSYVVGQTVYEHAPLDDSLAARLALLLTRLGLRFAGIDLIRAADGRMVFLEANSSPNYLDIERKTGAPISDRIAELILRLANEPGWHREGPARASPPSFVEYALPFADLSASSEGSLGRVEPPGAECFENVASPVGSGAT